MKIFTACLEIDEEPYIYNIFSINNIIHIPEIDGVQKLCHKR